MRLDPLRQVEGSRRQPVAPRLAGRTPRLNRRFGRDLGGQGGELFAGHRRQDGHAPSTNRLNRCGRSGVGSPLAASVPYSFQMRAGLKFF